MRMTFQRKIRAALAVLAIAVALPAQAAVVTFGPTPTEAKMNPLATATTGTVFQNVVGSVNGVRRSPWQGCGCGVGENDLDAYYTSVSGGATATYTFASSRTSLSFLWGSPDNYNDLEIVLVGGGGSEVINGTAAQGPVAIGAQFVTISDVGSFDKVIFRSGRNAFEFANLAAVPLPATLPLALFALGGLGVLHRRRKSA